MGRRFAVLQKVDDARHYAYRVLAEDGPLRDCPWCGLYASKDAAVTHANKHRVDVDDQATVDWESVRVIRRQPLPPPRPFVMPVEEVVTVPAFADRPAPIPVAVIAADLRAIPDLRPRQERREQRLRMRAVYWRVRRLPTRTPVRYSGQGDPRRPSAPGGEHLRRRATHRRL